MFYYLKNSEKLNYMYYRLENYFNLKLVLLVAILYLLMEKTDLLYK